MKTKPESILKEKIIHQSEHRPYSIHHTIVNQDSELALYLHWHDEFEFLYIEKGDIEIMVEDQSYHVREGDAVFIPVNLLHMAKRINAHQDCSYFALVFHDSLFTDSYPNAQYNRFTYPVRQNARQYVLHITTHIEWHIEILSLLKTIFSKSNQNIAEWELFFHGTLFNIWYILYTKHIENMNLHTNHEKLSKQLNQSIQWIHNQYHHEITLQHLASLSHLSEGAYCRSFKQLTGFTPFTYIIRFRIKKSLELLTETDKKVTEIALLCGFNSISHFNRAFLKYVNTTPSEYRKAQTHHNQSY